MKGLRWQIRDGRTVNFQKDGQVCMDTIEHIMGNIPQGKENEMAAEYITQQKTQDITKLRQNVSNHSLDKILGSLIPTNNFSDRLYWEHSKNGWLTMRSAIKLANMQDNPNAYEQPTNHWL